MPAYTVTLSDAEDAALASVSADPQQWIENVVKERCRIAIEEIVTREVKARLDRGDPIPSSRDEIVLTAPAPPRPERGPRRPADGA
jgi:hypothetical protein